MFFGLGLVGVGKLAAGVPGGGHPFHANLASLGLTFPDGSVSSCAVLSDILIVATLGLWVCRMQPQVTGHVEQYRSLEQDRLRKPQAEVECRL